MKVLFMWALAFGFCCFLWWAQVRERTWIHNYAALCKHKNASMEVHSLLLSIYMVSIFYAVSISIMKVGNWLSVITNNHLFPHLEESDSAFYLVFCLDILLILLKIIIFDNVEAKMKLMGTMIIFLKMSLVSHIALFFLFFWGQLLI